MNDKQYLDLAAKLSHLAHQGWDYGVYIARLDAAIYLVIPVIVAAFAIIAGLCFLPAAKRQIQQQAKNEYNYDLPGYAMVSGAFGVVALVCVGIEAFSPWAWITLFNPQLGLAHALLAKMAGMQ